VSSGRPLIGITIGPEAALRSDGFTYLTLRSTYVRAVELAGGAPVLIPPCNPDALQSLLERLDGIVFPGGPDVDPSEYGEAPHAKIDVNLGLDAIELPAARWAVQAEVPVLGICRGQQLLNVALGGSLVQHIDNHRQKTPRQDVSHILRLDADSRLARLLGCDTLEVNSFHHQAVDRLGAGLQAVAWSPDGVVEGLESTEHPWLVCVQYHPEDLIDAHAPSQRLLEGFLAACCERSGVSALVPS
jgi:putative glutamine amidotransferase